MGGVADQVVHLFRVRPQVVEFLGGAGHGKDITLVRLQLTPGFRRPEFFPGGEFCCGFHAQVLTFGPGIADIGPVVAAHHALMGLENMPVMFGKNHIAVGCRRILQQSGKGNALNRLRDGNTRKLEQGGRQVYGTDQPGRDFRADAPRCIDNHGRLDPGIIEPRFAAREGAAVVGAEYEIGVVEHFLPFQLFAHGADIVVQPADFMIVAGKILAGLRSVKQIGRHGHVLRRVAGRVLVELPVPVRIG
ncbi:MAG: hypothetical protein BWY09_02183 [Candidatus Hydrogenedentes bacterium ADurb.Bin179]|nr:MAG: hypothetical protein BWY09_02183 [Candidatus Hydrogenedentes bacterium ADurb.Bin179]